MQSKKMVDRTLGQTYLLFFESLLEKQTVVAEILGSSFYCINAGESKYHCGIYPLTY